MTKLHTRQARHARAVLLAALLLGYGAVAQAVSVGEQAAPFQLQDGAGRRVALEDYKGRMVLLNFWATWCAPCRQELPLLNELQKNNKTMTVLAVNIDSRSVNVEKFLRGRPLPDLTVLHDSDGRVVDSYRPRAMPASFLIDGEGVVRFVHYGFNETRDPARWAQEIDLLSRGRP